MIDWFRDLWDQDAYANLKFLHEEAVRFAWDLRARRQAQGIVDADRLLIDLRHFFQRVREKNETIGFVRATRILRHGAMPIRGIDSSAYKDIDLEAAIAWADQVVENIEHEVDVIERKRIFMANGHRRHRRGNRGSFRIFHACFRCLQIAHQRIATDGLCVHDTFTKSARVQTVAALIYCPMRCPSAVYGMAGRMRSATQSATQNIES